MEYKYPLRSNPVIMIEHIIHNNEKLNLFFDEHKLEITGKFLNGENVFMLIYHIFESTIKISDFKVYKKREKLGTQVLARFESSAKKHNYKKIFGELVNSKFHSPPEVLIKFYKKMGYKINLKKQGPQFALNSKKIH